MNVYSYCEPVTATSGSKWHVRKLSNLGYRFGGGIDTFSLCGKVKEGWDIRAVIHRVKPDFICDECWKRMMLDTSEAAG